MRIPQYWAKENYTGVNRKGRELSFWAWGWSFNSLTGAKEEAKVRAKRILDAIANGGNPDSYDYLENPLREEIMDSVGPSGKEMAIVTRNRYGSLVLNCQSICFVDVDFPKVQTNGMLDTLLLLFSPKRRLEKTRIVQQDCIGNIKAWSQDHPKRSFRLYQTAAGLRLLFTDKSYDPVSDEVSNLLGDLGSDPLYRKLTLKQECFRARLTPKPWRCGCNRPPNRYPWETPDAEHKYRRWQHKYEAKSKGYATCSFLETFGDPLQDESFSEIVSLHDQFTCRDGKVVLA